MLLTCFNRREKTLACLERLHGQRDIEGTIVSTYLVDDGSTDGTATAVQARFPDVTLLQGTGQLFWNGGMREAFAAAQAGSFDFYLWLNDDTLLDDDALSRLLCTADALEHEGRGPAMVSGATRDPLSGETTYGGVVRQDALRRLRFRRVRPSDVPVRCDTMNGNCVLLPRAVVERTGNLSDAFSHYLGDYDYGLRATRLGCSVWMAAGHVGTCEASGPTRHDRSGGALRSNLDRVNEPKGLTVGGTELTPFREWRVFCRRHGGWLWPLYWLLPYRRLLSRRPADPVAPSSVA